MGETMMRTKRWVAAILALALLATACGAGTEEPAAAPEPADEATPEEVTPDDDEAPEEATDEQPDASVDEPGPAETTSLTVGVSLPNVGSQAPLFIAEDQGFFADEGLDVEIIVTEEVRAGLVGGSLEFAAVESADVALSAAEGIPIVGVAAWRARQPFFIAVRSEIEQPEDLAGQDILLGGAPGTEDFDIRSGVLADEGFDISGVDFNPVTVPGGSNAWVELFLEGQLSMTVFFARHRPLIEDAGHRVVSDAFKEWPNDTLTSSRSFVDDNPNTTVRFLRALLRAHEIWKDLDQQEYVQELMLANDFNIAETEFQRDIYAADPEMYNRDMCPSPPAFDDLFAVTGETAPDFDLHHDVSYLHQAQRLVGLETCP